MPTPANPTAIPSVTALREQLGYGDSQKEKFHDLKDAMQDFRNVFVTDEGIHGKSLVDWKSDDQQTALSKMVQAFLDRDNNTERFWPDDGAFDAVKLKYSTDQERIKEILRQLFWRLNVQGSRNRNSKYRKSLSKENETDRGSKSGLDFDNAIELESVEDEEPPLLRPARQRSRTVRAYTVGKDMNESELSENASRHSGISRDQYLVPRSPDLTTQAQAATFAPFAEMAPSTKRRREVDLSSARSESSSKRGRKSSTQIANRSSTRQRKVRREPEWATPEQYWAAGESPEHPPSPGSTSNGLSISDGAIGANVTSSTQPTVEDLPQEDPVNAFLDEWTMQENAVAESIPTAADIPKNQPIAPTTTRGEDVAQRPNAGTEPLSVHPVAGSFTSEPTVLDGKAVNAGSRARGNAELDSVDPIAVKPQVKFIYTIVAHYPKYRERNWKPKEGFGKKKLSELLTEFPSWVRLSDVESLHFLLETSNAEVEKIIKLGQEEKFEMMKTEFEKRIREELARAANNSQVEVSISIDVRTGRDPGEEEIDVEGISFSWL